MSKFLLDHNDDAKAIAIPRFSPKTAELKFYLDKVKPRYLVAQATGILHTSYTKYKTDL